MEIIFLGTGQAVPTAQRNHTAILLKYEDENILVDCGEGTQRQFRKAGLNPCKLTKILITHWHGDHILGIPGLLQTLALNNYSNTLDVYGPSGTKKYMDHIMGMFVFVGKIDVQVHEIEEGVFYDKKFILEATPLEHGTPTLAYSFIEKEKKRIDMKKAKNLGLKAGPLIGELQRGKTVKLGKKTVKFSDIGHIDQGKKITFIFDTRICKEGVDAGKDADLVISEATYTEEMKDKAAEYKHLTASQAASIAKAANAKKLYLSHISQRHEHEFPKILKEARKVFKNTFIAEDLMKIEV